MGETHPSSTARVGNIPTDAVTKGRSQDIADFPAAQEVWCAQCGFRCNLARDARDIDAFAGESITSGSVLATETTDSFTVLLLHCNGTDGSTTFTDEKSKTVTANGNAQIGTAQSVFGGASALFDGTGDYLSLADSDDWNFGTGNFTLEARIRSNISSIDLAQAIFSQRADADNRWILFYNIGENKIAFTIRSGGVDIADYYHTPSPALQAGIWYHIGLVRSGKNIYLFIDGVLQTWTNIYYAISDSYSVPDLAAELHIGEYGSSYYLNGWLDEARISKGIARWTVNFTPSDIPYGLTNGNGSFEDWTSGNPDDWTVSGTITQETQDGYFDWTDGGVSSVKITRDGSDISLSQELLTPSNFNSNKVIFRIRVKSNTNEVIRLRMIVNSTDYYSSYNVAQQRFQELSVEAICPATVSSLIVYILADNANGTAYVDQAMLTRDGNPTTASVNSGCPMCGSSNYFSPPERL